MPSPATVPTREYTVSIAHTPAQVEAAQRLRRAVFVDEFNAALPGELDRDEFDDRCDHLIVEHADTVVGTYRLLPPGRTDRLYSSGEFDLAALRPLRESLIEAGRSCVHPDHRGGQVINLMWGALARYALLSGARHLAGCASVSLADGGQACANTWQLARRRHLSPAHLRVEPHLPWNATPTTDERPSYARVPPLLRGYLRLGAWVCGPPAHDPDFGVADFFVLLPLDRIDDRYLRHFLGQTR
ncbi:putative hemolysin [Saccharomonospora amisosensis]|uniref:Putative hemolysin n=1 Tax=Saccharomonospora amisosensis TaxID=1128677 RepID=A0A7X5UV73_9PSEU|nr:GNAT family N-acyltransferase [Saccharomonospora amisosensis]NIJ14720.1 putative hemolysin [Saccharomonospora amisosensis]